MLVRIGNPFVILFAIFVLVSIRVRIAPAPELFDEPLPLVIGLELLEGFSLFVRNNVCDVVLQPVLVGPF